MSQLEILPVIDTDTLRQKANEFAMKGAIKEIEEFYSGYGSPYRKALQEELQKQEIGHGLELPDIVALINEKLSNEIDVIANTAVAKTFVPMVSKLLTRVEKEITFSDILRQFIEDVGEKNPEDYYVSVDKNYQFEWLNVKISCESKEYKLTLHECHETRNEPVKKYWIGGLPWQWGDSKQQTMKLTIDNAELELPFVKDVLSDDFTAYIARLIFCDSHITMDTTYFTDDMFPQDECHCH
jgi:hypothetical protein